MDRTKSHEDVRADICKYMCEHTEQFRYSAIPRRRTSVDFDQYMADLVNDFEWGDHLTIAGAVYAYGYVLFL